MANFAVISNGIVQNIIVADSKEIAEEATACMCVEYTLENPAGIGLKWNDVDGFEQPSQENIGE